MNLMDLIKQGSFGASYVSLIKDSEVEVIAGAIVEEKGQFNTLLMHASELGIAAYLNNIWGKAFASEKKQELSALRKFTRKGEFFTASMLRALFDLAHSDLPVLYSAGVEKPNREDLKILLKIINQVDWNGFKGSKRCLYQPLLMDAGEVVRGRPDFVIDGRLIEIKSTIRPTIKREHIQQLAGYHFLDRFSLEPLGLERFEIYNPRHRTWRRYTSNQINEHLDAQKFARVIDRAIVAEDKKRATRVESILNRMTGLSAASAKKLFALIEKKRKLGTM